MIYPSPNFVVVAVPFTFGMTTGVAVLSFAHPTPPDDKKIVAMIKNRMTNRGTVTIGANVAIQERSSKHRIVRLRSPHSQCPHEATEIVLGRLEKLHRFTTRAHDARSKLLRTRARQGFYLITIVRTTLVVGKKFALPGCLAVIVPRLMSSVLVPTIDKTSILLPG